MAHHEKYRTSNVRAELRHGVLGLDKWKAVRIQRPSVHRRQDRWTGAGMPRTITAETREEAIQKLKALESVSLRHQQADAQSDASIEARFVAEMNERESALDEYRRWIDRRFGHLADAYRDARPMRYSTQNGRDTSRRIPFWRWAPQYLARMGRTEAVGEIRAKKDELGVVM